METNTGFSLADGVKREPPKNLTCARCGKIVTYKSLADCNEFLYPYLKGKLPICSKCFNGLIDEVITYIQQVIDKEDKVYAEATLYICQYTGLYYSESIAKKMYDGKNTLKENVLKYIHYAKTGNYKKYGYLKTIQNKINVENSNTSDVTMNSISEDTVKRFGRGFAPYQYKYLQDEYDDWTTRHECNTKAQEEIFIQICFAELDIYESRRVGDDVTKKVQTLQSLLDAAKLQPKQNHNESISDAQTFGTLIDKWEDEKPIPECEDKYKDVDDIAKYITAFFYGHTCKTVGIKNFYSKTYDDIMREYTVNRPEYDDDDTSEAIFDKIFGNKLKDESDAEREEK